jgi:hypothetical protein
MPKELFPVPIVFIIFNRPDLALRTFIEIAKIKPYKLLVIGDGPRLNVAGEEAKVLEARAILERVDWECEVLSNFSKDNLGCRSRVASGLDWVFGLVDEAIILEDDCLPSPSFFLFCKEMLQKYRYHFEIGMISGSNFQRGNCRGNGDYYFSKYMHIWGWATWSNRWRDFYDIDMNAWPAFKDSKDFLNIASSESNKRYWRRIFEKVYQGKINTWDYQWLFTNWLHKRLSIIPNQNLISNIGFGDDATHTKIESHLSNLSLGSLTFPLIHPNKIEANLIADQFTEKNDYSRTMFDLFKMIVKKLQKIFA